MISHCLHNCHEPWFARIIEIIEHRSSFKRVLMVPKLMNLNVTNVIHNVVH